jgi:hypothetical protein
VVGFERSRLWLALLFCALASWPAQAQTKAQVAQAFSDGVKLCSDVFKVEATQDAIAGVIKTSSFAAAPEADHSLPFARIFTKGPGEHLLLRPKWPGEGEPVLYAIFTVNPPKPATCTVVAIETPGVETQTLALLESPGEGWTLHEPESVDSQGVRHRIYHRVLDSKRTLELLLALPRDPSVMSAHASMALILDRRRR